MKQGLSFLRPAEGLGRCFCLPILYIGGPVLRFPYDKGPTI